ncbi:hypothetical protein FE392_17900 [Xenorhabdus sp. 12]|uniref:Uncharacterized protein n=1 Tax=Xenorhabdus santafensis TaxID=2582833 RepID=A0ABU4SEJ0_9GAMM|nr:hypothetical protein [Xenorhabdus sp. 12]MDX7989160.1 hypothetical protein [Xenorhabdus sp. 12]
MTFDNFSEAIAYARRRRREDKMHYAVNQRHKGRLTVGKYGAYRGKRPAWTTHDDERPEFYGVQHSRIIILHPSDAPLILELLAAGLTQKEVADKFSVSRAGLRKFVRKAKANVGIR